MNAEARTVDCLLVSTGRAASTAIYQYVDRAAGLGLPWNKEPHYWCDVRRHRGVYPMLEDLLVESEADYWGLYRDARYVLDASVGYFFYAGEVVQNLERAGQRPKLLFLYREPVSRAESFFNELKKKGLTDSATLADDLARPREAGLWWEYYYDNVDYYDNFLALAAFADGLLAVNYDYFKRHQRAVLGEVLRFLGEDPARAEGLALAPVNTSEEARLQTRLARYRWAAPLVPGPLRGPAKRLFGLVGGRAGRQGEPASADPRAHLARSLAQYEQFRNHIAQEDLLWLSGS